MKSLLTLKILVIFVVVVTIFVYVCCLGFREAGKLVIRIVYFKTLSLIEKAPLLRRRVFLFARFFIGGMGRVPPLSEGVRGCLVIVTAPSFEWSRTHLKKNQRLDDFQI